MKGNHASHNGAGHLINWGLLVACNLIWASQFALVKLVQQEVGPIFATAFPMLLATLLLIPIVGPRLLRRQRGDKASATASPGPTTRIPARDIWLFALLGIGGQVAAQLFVTWGVRHSLASNAALIQLALPVVTAVMAFMILRERMTRLRWVGFLFALAGVSACSLQDLRGLNLGGGYLLGNGLILGGVMGSAFYNVFSKKLLSRYSPLEVLLCSYLFVCLVLVPLALVLEPGGFSALPHLSGKAWLGLALLAVLQYFLSMVLFLTVLTRLDATQAALSNYLIPFFGVLLAWLLLNERLTTVMVVGGTLVLGSTLLVTVCEDFLARRRARLAATASA